MVLRPPYLVNAGEVPVEEAEELDPLPDIAPVEDELVLLHVLEAEDGAVIVADLVRILERDVEGLEGGEVGHELPHILILFPYVEAGDGVLGEIRGSRLELRVGAP
jgi:hypothetical protein